MICYPGEHGQHVQETFDEDQIIKSYYSYWYQKMVEAGKDEFITKENCIEDWKTIHWAEEVDEWGNKVRRG